MQLTLDQIPAMLHARAIACFNAGDVLGFLCKASNEHGRAIVLDNMRALKDRGIYEAALLRAWTGTRTNNAHWSTSSEVGAVDEPGEARRSERAGWAA